MRTPASGTQDGLDRREGVTAELAMRSGQRFCHAARHPEAAQPVVWTANDADKRSAECPAQDPRPLCRQSRPHALPVHKQKRNSETRLKRLSECSSEHGLKEGQRA